MKYKELPYDYKKERLFDMIKYLDNGHKPDINTMFIEEIRFIRQLYGAQLIQQKNFLKRTQDNA